MDTTVHRGVAIDFDRWYEQGAMWTEVRDYWTVDAGQRTEDETEQSVVKEWLDGQRYEYGSG